MAQSIHEGHRERMRKEIINNGISEHTPPHKILEFLLFYCISRKDTNPIAHKLIEKFGSLSGVLDADLDAIASVEGMNERSALLLKSIVPIARIYISEKTNEKPNFKNIDEIGNYALEKYIGVTVERAALISLSGKCKLLGFDFLAEGDISSVGLSFREVIARLIEHDASAAVLVHNHPSGFALPSEKDGIITESLAGALKNVGVYLVDHIVLGSGDFVSMAQSREYAHIFSAK